ncbi:MAG: methionyl-tRNA formyltransferase [Planctomycetota bacterium]
MRIAFFGSGEFALPTFDSIRMDGHEIVIVVSQPDKVRGRGKDVTPTPVKAAALGEGLEVLTPTDVNVAEVVAKIKAARADLAYVAAFGQKIGQELLNAFPVGIVNLHGSLLPAWRGAAPIQRSVMNGDHETGVTVFRIVEKMDAGPVLMMRRTAIGDTETADELHDRLSRIGCDAVRETLRLLTTEPTAPGESQDESRATLAPKLKKTDGHISFDHSTLALAHRICGMWSWPGAACRFVSVDGRRDEVVILARARAYQGRPDSAGLTPGTLTELLNVRTSDGELEILEIKPSGGSLMEWRDYVNGRHVKPSDRFLPIEPA